MIVAFRKGLKSLADENRPYTYVLTECIGVANMISGAGQYIAGKKMSFDDSATTRAQGRVHIARGERVFKLGAKQFMPGAINALTVAALATVAYYVIPRLDPTRVEPMR